MFAKVPFVLPLLFPKQCWKIPNSDKKIYLTFDDGPIPEVTEWVLELLKAHQICATFFCIGDNITKYPEIFKKIIHSGHQIGNHTDHHVNGWKTNMPIYLQEVDNCMTKIRSINSENRLLFRPPYGKIKPAQTAALIKRGYKIIMWTVLSKDYNPNTTEEICFQNVIKHSGSGSIIVFHDSLKAMRNLKAVLPRVIEHLLKEGYQFDVL